MAPPLPIPNREVKHVSAYDTAVRCGTIGHHQGFFPFKGYVSQYIQQNRQ
jgi:hypothetical protein